MDNMRNVSINEMIQNFTPEEWSKALQAAPFSVLATETDIRLEMLKKALDAFQGSEAREWN